MKLTRWKLLTGALGLSIGGIAAAAGDPNSVGVVSCAPTEKHTAFRPTETKPLPPMKVATAVEIAALAPPTEVPTLPSPPTIPLPVERPSAPALPASPPAAIPVLPVLPMIPDMKPVEVAPPKIESLKLPTPVDPVKPVELPIPNLTWRYENAPVATPIAPPPAETPKPIPVPAPRPDFKPLPFPAPAAELPKPVEPLKPVPADPIPATVPAKPIPAPSPAPVEATPASRPATIAPSAMKPGEKKLKAILYLGDDRPRFEVRDGDEIYLKVVSDRVDVKSPGEGVTTSTLRSMGRVTFVTPGGEGTCDDLAVLPGTGQVVVTGTVRFTYNWGRVETTVSGEKMTFRLGSTTVEPTTAVTPTGVRIGSHVGVGFGQ